MPYPTSILAAVDAVMQMANQKLGFDEDKIFLYGWSIGGFPATWVAANYPNIGGLVLDATFDDLLPLALIRMPPFIGDLVTFIIRKYMDLPIGKQVYLWNCLTKFLNHSKILGFKFKIMISLILSRGFWIYIIIEFIIPHFYNETTF